MSHLSLLLYHQGGHSRHQKEKEKKKQIWPLELQTLSRVDHTRSQEKKNTGENTGDNSTRTLPPHAVSLRIHTAQGSAPHWVCLTGARPSCEKISYFQKTKPLTSNEICLMFSLCISRFPDHYYLIKEIL